MTITATKLVDDNFKIIVNANGVADDTDQTLVDVVNSNNASSQPKVSIAHIAYEILGTGDVTVFFKGDTSKKVVINGRGNYGLKPSETKIKGIGDIKILTDANVDKFSLMLECHKETGFSNG